MTTGPRTSCHGLQAGTSLRYTSVPPTGRCSGRSICCAPSVSMTSGWQQRTVHRTARENRIKNYMPSGSQIRIEEDMTGKEKDDAAGHRGMVAIRPDIYRLAIEQGIDIGDVCNRALASLTGSIYPGTQQEKVPDLPPVIIARD